MAKKEKHWLNKNDMSKSLGISTTAFGKWGVKPVDKDGRENFYTVADVLANRLEYHNQKQGQQDSADYFLERTRLTTAQADKLEMENAITRQQQAPVALLEAALAQCSFQINSILGSIPGKIKKRIPELTAAKLAHINREVTKAQNAASKLKLDWSELSNID